MREPWRAVVLSGGAALGEFQVGVMQELSRSIPRFDFHAGVSVGALNATVIAQHGSLDAGAEKLTLLWDAVTGPQDVYATPRLGTIGGAVGTLLPFGPGRRDSVWDTEPLRWRIANHIAWEGLRGKANWGIGVSSLNDGAYYLVTNHPGMLADFQGENPGLLRMSLDPAADRPIPDHLIDLVLASASIPGVFPPVDLFGHRFVDGSLRDVAPLSTAFDAYRAHLATDGASPSDEDLLLVVSCLPASLGPLPRARLRRGVDVLERTVEMLIHEVVEDDIGEALWRNEAQHPDVRRLRIHVLRPRQDLGLGILGFGQTDLRRELREHGRQVAAEALGASAV